MKIDLYNADSLTLLRKIPDNSAHCIIQDPPYNTTKCKWEWDLMELIEEYWKEWERILIPNGAIIFTASQPFTSKLILSNEKMFKYTLVYEKSTPTGHLNAKKMPLRCHEDIVVFYNKLPTYNPQKTSGHIRKVSKASSRAKSIIRAKDSDKVYNNEIEDKVSDYDSTERYPRSVLKFSTDKQKSTLHPTQKPEALMEYLVKTFSNEGDTILDGFMGSGTTGVACKNLNRNFIGIELDEKYFNIAKERIGE